MSSTPPPMPVIPVNPPYATALPTSEGRPGLVTAIGVLSIILAVLQGASAVGWMSFSAASMISASVQQRQIARTGFPMTVAAAAPDDAPKGLAEPVARVATQGFSRRHPMSVVRQGHVMVLLTRQGKELLPFAEGSTLTPTRVAGQITDAGAMGASADYYEIGEGRLEVTDQQAVFRRSDGEVFRSTDPAVDRALTEPQIDMVIGLVGMAVDETLTVAQTEGLRTALRDPEQRILTPNEFVSTGGKLPDGTAWFLSVGGQIRVGPDGTVQRLAPTTPLPNVNPRSGKPISTFWAGLLVVDGLVTGALAIVLLVAGILLLRGRPTGRRLHLWWAVLKLPLALLGAMVCGLAVAEWLETVTPANAGSPPRIAASGWGTGIAVAVGAIAYPVVVLIAMSRDRVKSYFEGVL